MLKNQFISGGKFSGKRLLWCGFGWSFLNFLFILFCTDQCIDWAGVGWIERIRTWLGRIDAEWLIRWTSLKSLERNAIESCGLWVVRKRVLAFGVRQGEGVGESLRGAMLMIRRLLFVWRLILILFKPKILLPLFTLILTTLIQVLLFILIGIIKFLLGLFRFNLNLAIVIGVQLLELLLARLLVCRLWVVIVSGLVHLFWSD